MLRAVGAAGQLMPQVRGLRHGTGMPPALPNGAEQSTAKQSQRCAAWHSAAQRSTHRCHPAAGPRAKRQPASCRQTPAMQDGAPGGQSSLQAAAERVGGMHASSRAAPCHCARQQARAARVFCRRTSRFCTATSSMGSVRYSTCVGQAVQCGTNTQERSVLGGGRWRDTSMGAGQLAGKKGGHGCLQARRACCWQRRCCRE